MIRISVKHMPNLLSILRILLSLLMAVVWKNNLIFMIVYTLCGLTDILDGYIARKFDAVSKLGAKLDSIGDLTFFVLVSYWIVIRSSISITKLTGGLLAAIILVRAINIIITKLKFKQFGIMHTVLNKLTGVFCFLLVPILIINDSIATEFLIMLLIFALVSAIEEWLHLMLFDTYQENPKSIVGRIYHRYIEDDNRDLKETKK